MSVRRGREHISWPLNVVAIEVRCTILRTTDLAEKPQRTWLNFCVAGPSSCFDFLLYSRDPAWRDRYSKMLTESGIDRLHNALSRICIWRKLGSPRAALLLVSSPYAELIRGLRRTRDNAPHKFAMSELSCEIRMMRFSVVVIRSSLIVFRRREILLGSRTRAEGVT
jgi:hypothetical protein